MNREELRELFADLAHKQWSGWMEYLFSKCDTNFTLPEWAVERWQRQMKTEYANLSEEEKNSDRDEADKMIIIAEQYANSKTSELQSEMKMKVDYYENKIEAMINGNAEHQNFLQSEISRLNGEKEKLQFSEGMNSKCLYDTECQRSLYKTIAEVLSKDLGEDIEALLDSCGLSGEVEIVDAPNGTKTNESYGIFKDVHVDQWSTGDSGDSYAGFIYAKLKNTWIKVPYEC